MLQGAQSQFLTCLKILSTILSQLERFSFTDLNSALNSFQQTHSNEKKSAYQTTGAA